jgi:hypothetical protein
MELNVTGEIKLKNDMGEVCSTNESTTVSEQWLGKHVPTETDSHVTIDLVWKRGAFHVVRGEILWAEQFEATSQLSSARAAEKRWRYSWVVSWRRVCTGGCDKGTGAREAEESEEAVARERLIKTQPVEKRLSWCSGDLWSVEISDSAVTTCSSEWCV